MFHDYCEGKKGECLQADFEQDGLMGIISQAMTLTNHYLIGYQSYCTNQQ